jgi:hypothetical protein
VVVLPPAFLAMAYPVALLGKAGSERHKRPGRPLNLCSAQRNNLGLVAAFDNGKHVIGPTG